MQNKKIKRLFQSVHMSMYLNVVIQNIAIYLFKHMINIHRSLVNFKKSTEKNKESWYLRYSK
ncbi:hypothetical protein CQU01_16360 [Cerasibacillus quisquiliarum]|uniref:Uncharacterized protein n=1 Tax=Cerasibacillus quisquiliarum TaxID=227865 RepID=A0A511V0D2_9BACI|nr:hypothetical protein CQU01_16360 [Cerasibacillus quisquiliarum]